MSQILLKFLPGLSGYLGYAVPLVSPQGKGVAITKAKLKNLLTGAIIEKTCLDVRNYAIDDQQLE